MQRGNFKKKQFQASRVIINRNRSMPRPANYYAYRGCKKALNNFFKNPSRETLKIYRKKLGDFEKINSTGALILRKYFKDEMFKRVLKEEDYQ